MARFKLCVVVGGKRERVGEQRVSRRGAASAKSRVLSAQTRVEDTDVKRALIFELRGAEECRAYAEKHCSPVNPSMTLARLSEC